MANRKLFVNLSIKELKQTVDFFSGLGFAFDPKFTNDKAACMILNPEAFVMLLPEDFFRTFTRNAICDTSSHTETLLAISCESRADVDQMVDKALASGGSRAMDPQDHGFMYGWSFYDPNGHHWEVLWMDPNAAPPA